MANAPVTADLYLFPQQGEFFLDQAYAVAAITGVGAGKSRVGAVTLLKYLVDHPGALSMVTAPTFPMLRDATLRTVFEVWPKEVIAPSGWQVGTMTLKLINGSEVLFRSTDDPEHLRGPNLAYVWMDEAAQSSLEAFRILQGRLRQPGFPARMRITTTPKGYNWVFDEFAKEERPNYRLHQWSLRDNPYVSAEFLASLEESYDADYALQEIEGKFVVVGGRASFDADWLQILQGRGRKADREEFLPPEKRDTRTREWGVPLEWHQYILGIDPKGQGKDRGYAILLDYTTGDLMGEVFGQNRDASPLRAACTKLALRYTALVVPETNGVGAEWADRMMEAGSRVFRRPRRDGEKADSDAFRTRPYGWNTDVLTRPLMLGALQEGFRSHRLSTPNLDIVHAAGSWDPEENPHLPDILSAAGIAAAAGRLLWGELGSTVLQAEQANRAPRVVKYRLGHSPRPFPVFGGMR